MKHFPEAHNEFSLTYFKELVKEKPGDNTISLSMGVAVAVGMLMIGARRKTLDEIKKALQLYGLGGIGSSGDGPLSGDDDDKAREYFEWLKDRISFFNDHGKHPMMQIAGQLFQSSHYELLSTYKDNIKKYYDAGTQKVDFMNSTEEVRQQINAWVAQHTNGDIMNFIAPNNLDPSTIVALMNATLFRGMWEKPFNPKHTGKGIFWTCKDQSIYVDMMTQSGTFNIATISNPSMEILEMPFYNRSLCMYFVVPKGHTSIDEVMNNLSYIKIREWTSSENMTAVHTTVSIPKFTMTRSYSMKGPLTKMGVKDLFIPGKADLSGMSGASMPGDTPFHVSQMSQAVVFTINEAASEITGASRTEVVPGSQSDFKVNRSFICFVKDKLTGVLYIIGKICKPKQHALPE